MKKIKIGILLVLGMLALVSVASAMPATITLSSRHAPNDPTSYIRMVTATGDSDVPTGSYAGWCVGFTIHGLGTAMTYNVADSRGSLTGTPAYIQSTQWNKVNWILNNPNGDWRITQAAIWKVDGGTGTPYPSDSLTTGYSHSAFDAYMLLVNAQGSFDPAPGDKFAVILWKREGQPLVLPAKVPSIPSPEFPSAALPVGMMISIVGVVYYIRTREE